MPQLSIEPTGLRLRYAGLFNWPNDPHVHIKDHEIVTPQSHTFTFGDVVTLTASQNKYSFDYYEIWEPVELVHSTYAFKTAFGFIASFDPITTVRLNSADDITGTNGKIIARYR